MVPPERAPTEDPAAPAVFTPESLFRDYFWPLYPEDAQADLARARAEDANPAGNPALVRRFDEAAETFVKMAPRLFGKDDPGLDGTDASVHRLSRALTYDRREAFRRKGRAGTPENELFNVVVHGTAYVAACVRNGHGGVLRLRRPSWESLVTLESRAGRGDLAIFQWWLKSLADAPLRGETGTLTLADRYRAHVEVPCTEPEALPVLAAPRVIPALKKVRYDTLYKHLRAHVPEVRDLGEDFPTAERFEAYGLTSLEAHLVGEGRMLLLFGVAKEGAHLFWIGQAGFEKAAFFPAESFPAPVLRADGDKLAVLLRHEGKDVRHEMLWWGP